MNNKFALFLVSTLLGFLIIIQIRASGALAETARSNSGELLALSVSRLITDTSSLRIDVQKLEERKSKLNDISSSSNNAEEAVTEAVSEYQIFSGKAAVSGPGVALTIGRPLEQTELVDVVNILRGLGAEAISIDTDRIITSTGLNAARYTPPFSIQAIGSPAILYEGLNSKMGIVDQINRGNNYCEVKKVETITLPEARPLSPKAGTPKDT